jgi:hypothetical protein
MIDYLVDVAGLLGEKARRILVVWRVNRTIQFDRAIDCFDLHIGVFVIRGLQGGLDARSDNAIFPVLAECFMRPAGVTTIDGHKHYASCGQTKDYRKHFEFIQYLHSSRFLFSKQSSHIRANGTEAARGLPVTFASLRLWQFATRLWHLATG